MKESQFIEQNKKKWLEFENSFQKKDADPASTSKLFVQITEDLSYAETFYTKRSVRIYLNGVAKLLFNDLNKTKTTGFKSFLEFWRTDLPKTVYKARRAMLLSTIVFVCCFALGVVTSQSDSNFARAILSNDYVNITDQNIAKGDPMAIYKNEGEMKMFLPILFNNLRVCYLTFFSGIFMAIGTFVIMITNGIMVGVFQYYFIEHGLFWPSFLTIWTHGSLEIPAIILSGGAGLTLGRGLLFPGTYSRMQSFLLSALDGLKIILGTTPVIVLAAFVEGFLTRHTELPDAVRLAFILIAFSSVIVYFFWYPRKVGLASTDEKTHNSLVYKVPEAFDTSRIYSVSKIITETFRVMFMNFSLFVTVGLSGAIGCTLLICWNPGYIFRLFEAADFFMSDLLNFSQFTFLGVFVILCFASLSAFYFHVLSKRLKANVSDSTRGRRLRRTFFCALGLSAVVFFILYIDLDYAMLITHILCPLIVFISCISYFQNLPLGEAVGYSGSLISQSVSRFLLTALLFTLLSVIFYFLTFYLSRILMLDDALILALTSDETVAENIHLFLCTFQTLLSLMIYLVLTVVSSCCMYFSLNEIYTAEHLKAKIAAIPGSQ